LTEGTWTMWSNG